MYKSRISDVANMSFNAILENKILAKISEFTVYESIQCFLQFRVPETLATVSPA